MERLNHRRTPHRGASGFTLVELLVVIAIIGVLVGLLLPAVQAAREAARRTQCTNQVRQIMLGMINLESARKTFPSGGVVPWPRLENYLSGPGGSPYGPEKQGLGWAFQILPYLENNAVYDLKTTAAVESVYVPGFNCPSRRGPTQTREESESAGSAGIYPYLIDYAAAVPYPSRGDLGIPPNVPNPFFNMQGTDTRACALNTFWGLSNGGGPVTQSSIVPVSQLNGFKGYWGVVTRSNYCVKPDGSKVTIGWYDKISYNQITDGSSNTFVISEKRLQPSLYAIGSADDDKGFSGGWDQDAMRISACKIGPDEDSSDPTRVIRFGSAHASIMNAGFADGSVRAINYDVDLETLNNLAHRSDGYTVNLDDL